MGKAMVIRYAIISALLAVVLAVGIAALGTLLSPSEDGLAAYNKGDYATALRLLRPVAEQGDAIAQYNLALMHHIGQGIPPDGAAAEKWYRLAAEQGNGAAQNNLGIMYAKGEAVPRDYVRAHKWLDLAASRFPQKERRDMAVKAREQVAAEMSPAEIAEAKKLAREWSDQHL